jgi:hypothetical protein
MGDALMKEEDDMDELVAIYYPTQNMALLVQQQAEASTHPRLPKNHHSQARSQRRKFHHDQALASICRDYLGLNCLLGAEFQLMFCISQGWFQVLMEDVMALGNPFYVNSGNCNQQLGTSIKAKLLMPLKCLAYRVPSHFFVDYFSMSATMCLEVGCQFNTVVVNLYQHEYLCVPDANDHKAICHLHKEAHGVDGMVGLLDCLHTYWKKLPKGLARILPRKGREANHCFGSPV